MTERRAADGSSLMDSVSDSWPRKRVIWSCSAAKGPLLTRWYLIDTRWFTIYLHHLHVSDEDRALHDHPWWFVTFLLSSGYWEHVPGPQRGTTIRVWHRRFSLLYRHATWQHRLELVRPTWTIVLRSRHFREWGFITRTGWQHWKEYGKQWCD